jgi:NADH-quinone oxidoreductase subunit G
MKNEVQSIFKNAKRPMILIGKDILNRNDSNAILHYLSDFANNSGVISSSWNGFNVIFDEASQAAAQEFGFKFSKSINEDFVFSLGCEHIKSLGQTLAYIGHHPYETTNSADYIIPAAGVFEKNGTYVNLEGRVQKANKIINSAINVFPDYEILLKIGKGLGLFDKLNSYNDIFAAMCSEFPSFGGEYLSSNFALNFEKEDLDWDEKIIDSGNIYLNDIISQNSPTLARFELETHEGLVKK